MLSLRTSVIIIHNQRLVMFSKIYKTAAAGLDIKKKDANFTLLYLCWNEEERETAFRSTKEDTIKGKVSLVGLTRRFFNFDTTEKTKDFSSMFSPYERWEMQDEMVTS